MHCWRLLWEIKPYFMPFSFFILWKIFSVSFSGKFYWGPADSGDSPAHRTYDPKAPVSVHKGVPLFPSVGYHLVRIGLDTTSVQMPWVSRHLCRTLTPEACTIMPVWTFPIVIQCPHLPSLQKWGEKVQDSAAFLNRLLHSEFASLCKQEVEFRISHWCLYFQDDFTFQTF